MGGFSSFLPSFLSSLLGTYLEEKVCLNECHKKSNLTEHDHHNLKCRLGSQSTNLIYTFGGKYLLLSYVDI